MMATTRYSRSKDDRPEEKEGRRLNSFLGLSLNDRTILFLVMLLDKTVSVDLTVFALGRSLRERKEENEDVVFIWALSFTCF